MEGLHKLTIDKLPQFLLGGKANFVISDINNPDLHIEFKVRENVKQPNMYYVSYKNIDWIYIGYVSQTGTDLPLFYKSHKRLENDAMNKAEIFRKFILFVYHLNKLPINLEVYYTGQCSICGRKLTNPIYIEIGIGEICLQKC